MSGKYKRFLTDLKQDYNHVIDNARNYVENTKVDNGISPYHYSKPYDRVPGHAEYFRLMYFALNMLQAMNIPQPARILEVGSGSGWLTEILVALGVIVDGIEPSEDFNKLARQRIDAAFQHYRLDHFDRAPRANFYTTTLEECDFPDDTFDGIIFFATLHHLSLIHI